MEKIYFFHTYCDYHVNGANRSYWAKFFRQIARNLHEESKLKLHSSYDEDMPIYEYYSKTKELFVRIMQYNPCSDQMDLEKYTTDRYFTAWIDERILFVDDAFDVIPTKPELVVCLLMTKTNIDKAKSLINTWLFEEEIKTKDLIEEIYKEQDRLDEQR